MKKETLISRILAIFWKKLGAIGKIPKRAILNTPKQQKFYKQISGTSIGAKLAPWYACIFIGVH